MIIVAVVLVGMQLSKNKEPELEPACADKPARLTLYVETDDQMRALAGKLSGDRRLSDPQLETKAKAYESFQKLFKDQPELVKLTRQEALPASIKASVSQDEANALATEIQARYPEISRAVAIRCPVKGQAPGPGHWDDNAFTAPKPSTSAGSPGK
ncbi:hypothetical protein D5S17_04240 [Pseudonocardiaceae bacterium YIM PH 21723]|nr:hypothetical protein D5S17_04240 [Pseudonocardiaceae bacterium YIM PH 21723]